MQAKLANIQMASYEIISIFEFKPVSTLFFFILAKTFKLEPKIKQVNPFFYQNPLQLHMKSLKVQLYLYI